MPSPDEKRQIKQIRRELDGFIDAVVVGIARNVKTSLERRAPRETGLLAASFQLSRTPEGQQTRRGGSPPIDQTLEPGPVPRPAYVGSTLSYGPPVESEQNFVDGGIQEALARSFVQSAAAQGIEQTRRSRIVPRFRG